HEQHQRQSEFSHDQQGTHSLPSSSGRAGAAAFLQRFVAINTRYLPGGSQPEEDPRQNPDAGGKEQDVSVQADGDASRKVLRSELQQYPDSAISGGQSRQGSGSG